MEQRQLDELYQLASEHYLNGRFAEALQAWRQLLTLNPDDERAQEGIRLAELMAEGEAAPASNSQPAGVPVHAVPAATPDSEMPGRVVEIEEDLLGPASPEPETAAMPEAGEQQDGELDENLAVLDSLSVPGMITSPTARDEAHLKDHDGVAARPEPPQPEGQRNEIDFGDLTKLDAIPTVAAPLSDPAPTVETPAAETPAADTPDEAADPAPVELAALSQRATFAPPPPADPPAADDGSDPVAAELKKRIDDLMDDATAAAEQGRDQDALGLLSRVFILDEEHAGGRALEEAIGLRGTDVQKQIENWMTEAVQWLEMGQIAEARDRFELVLENAPDHLEAQDYLAKADARLAGGEDDGSAAEAAPAGDVAAPSHADERAALNHEPMSEEPGVESVPLAAPVGADLGVEATREADTARAPAAAEPPPRKKIPVILLLGMVVVIGLAAGGYLYGPGLIDRFFGAPEATSRAEGPEGPTPAPATTEGESGEDPTAAAGVAAVPGPAPQRGTVGIGESLSRAHEAMAASDYSAAIVAYNEVLELDPGNTEARRGIREAGDLYREQRTAEEQVERGRIALEDGDYVAALRIFYRVPGHVDQTRLARYKVIGWYNLGLVELKSADCETALDHFDEALAIAPEEERLLKALELAERYSGVPKDSRFYHQVEALKFLVP